MGKIHISMLFLRHYDLTMANYSYESSGEIQKMLSYSTERRGLSL